MNYFNQPQPQFYPQQMPSRVMTPPAFNPNQFQQMAMNMPENMLSQLVVQAQMSGINNQDIQKGLEYINSFRNQTQFRV